MPFKLLISFPCKRLQQNSIFREVLLNALPALVSSPIKEVSLSLMSSTLTLYVVLKGLVYVVVIHVVGFSW